MIHVPNAGGDSLKTQRTGSLKIERYGGGKKFQWGKRRINIAVDDLIEFDIKTEGVAELFIKARGGGGGFQKQNLPAPEKGSWVHMSVSAKNFPTKKKFSQLYFEAVADDAKENYVLLDNLVVRSSL